MSSKTQLNDYNKTLKREISELKRDNKELVIERNTLNYQLRALEIALSKSRLRERRWYHFF